jgi:hypothetical protein
VSELDPRLSKAVTTHSSIVAALNVIHSLRTRGLPRTLLFAALGTAYQSWANSWPSTS